MASQSPAREDKWGDETIRPSSSTLPKIPISYNNVTTDGGEGIRKASSSRACLVAEQRLSDFFPSASVSSAGSRSRYSDADLQKIADLLRLSQQEAWSSVPRTYTVLRCIGQLQLVDDFINEGFSDIWFPFTQGNLPSQLSPSIKTQFINTQSIVFTQALDLEKGENGKHATFATGEPLWFESRGKLGRGAFGVVDKVVSLITLCEYARKRMRRGNNFTRSRREIQAFKAELAVLKTIDHRHCVRLVGSYTDPKYVGLIMEPVADCDLAAFLVAALNNNDKKSQLRNYFGCLAGALQYLHDRQIRHRDIKPANILVKGDCVYLADFGIALDWSEMTQGTTTTDTAKSPIYCAPEVARWEPRGPSSDIWSLGCVFVEMVTVLKGRCVEDMRAYFKAKTENYMFHCNIEPCWQWLADLKFLSTRDNPPVEWSLNMLAFDRNQRYTADQLLDTIRHISMHNASHMINECFCDDCCMGDNDLLSSSSSSEGEDPWADLDEESTVRGIVQPFSSDLFSDEGHVSRDNTAAMEGSRTLQSIVRKLERTNSISTSPHAPKAVSSDTWALSAVLNNNQSLYNYNPASHTGLRSYYPPNSEEMPPISPSANNQWPIVDSPREPMLRTFDVKRFNSLSLSKDPRIAVREEQKPIKEKQRQTVKERQKLTLEGVQKLTREESQKPPDGKLVASASSEQTVRLWDSATGAACRTLQGHSYWVRAVAFSPDGKLVASVSDDTTVRLWDSATGAARHTLHGHSGPVWAIAFSPDGKLVASVSYDTTVRLWDSATGVVRHTLQGHSYRVRAVAFSPDGKLVASASGNTTVSLWDSATGVVRHTLQGHSYWVRAVAFSPDGKLVASTSDDTTVRLWDSATGVVRHTLQGHSYRVRAVAFSPDGKLVASASDDTTVRLWDSATGAVRYTLHGHLGPVGVIAFSPDGKLVASASYDTTVRLWDSVTGAAHYTLQGHSGPVWAIAFSPDGKLVASASGDLTGRLWDSATGAACYTLQGHSGPVGAVAFSPDGKLVASASGDTTVRLWDSAMGTVGS